MIDKAKPKTLKSVSTTGVAAAAIQDVYGLHSILRVKDGCYAFLGNGKDSVGGCMLHKPHYDFNDNILETGPAYWVTCSTAGVSCSNQLARLTNKY